MRKRVWHAKWSRRAVGPSVVLLLGVSAVVGAPAASATGNVSIPIQIGVPVQRQFLEPNGTPGCEQMFYATATIPADVVSYQGSVDLYNNGVYAFTDHFFSPGDTTISYGDLTYDVPAGSVGWFVSYGGGPGPCSTDGSFQNLQLTGLVGTVISGTVTDTCGNPVAGVAMTTSAVTYPPRTQTTTTDANGFYSVLVYPNTNYSITPALSPDVFSPHSPVVPGQGADITQNFTTPCSVPTVHLIQGAPIVYPHGGTVNADFQIYLDSAPTASVTVDWATTDGTAVGGNNPSVDDYQSGSGTVTFPAGQQSEIVSIPVYGHANVGADKTFTMTLSDPQGAQLGSDNSVAQAIHNAAVLFINGTTVTGPVKGKVKANVIVNLDAPTTLPVTFSYATSDDSAVAGTDYTAASGTTTLKPGKTQFTIPVSVLANVTATGNRDFTTSITNIATANVTAPNPTTNVTITDTDPSVSVSDVVVKRPSTGTAKAIFAVSLSGAPTGPITMHYATVDGSALTGTDYKAKSGTITFSPTGPTTRTIPITVLVNPAASGSATFSLQLTQVVPGWAPVTKNTGLATLTSGSLLLESDHTTVWGNGHDAAMITVSTNDGNGNPVMNQKIDLTASPSTGVKIVPANAKSDVTGPNGQATFKVTSTAPIDPNSTPHAITLTATTASSPFEAPNTIDLTFVRHTVVVQFLGITTSLACSGGNSSTCTDPDAGTPTPSDVFAGLRDNATLSGYTASDFLWYSYNGGHVDSKTGEWRPYSYNCGDTAQSYATDITHLRLMINAYTKANPNTDLILVGHSQGGLVAFQQLALNDIAPSDRLTKLITLDSPLGGVPVVGTTLSSIASGCWIGAAPTQLAALYTAENGTGLFPNQPVGDNSPSLCSFLLACSNPATNAQLVLQAESQGVTVDTFGSTDDAVYTPGRCTVAAYAVPTTQVITEAGGGLNALGNDYGGLLCIHNSHVAVVSATTTDLFDRLSTQTGG
ncbi:MAG TPA: Calx-beta domain-containing protein [Acidimicrobiia bacterium]|jgi:pimeloyl-ACP methyl ester carboxylesterase